jgi:hypothetical protein
MIDRQCDDFCRVGSDPSLRHVAVMVAYQDRYEGPAITVEDIKKAVNLHDALIVSLVSWPVSLLVPFSSQPPPIPPSAAQE